MKLRILFFSLLCFPLALFAGENDDLLKLTLVPTDYNNTYRLTVTDDYTLWTGEVVLTPDQLVCEELEKGLSFCGKLSSDGQVFRGFIKSGFMHYQVIMTKTEEGQLQGNWNKLVRAEPQPTPLRKNSTAPGDYFKNYTKLDSDTYAQVYFAGRKY